jgi:chitodextrinase
VIHAAARTRRRELPLWKRWLPIIVGLLFLLLAPVLCYAQNSVTLVWTAPGDDGQIGTASSYEIRYSPSPITTSNWGQSTLVPGAPAPQIAGTRQSVTIQGLTQGTTYYFAMRTQDDAGNWAPLSNVLRWDWIYDTAPPAAPSGLVAAREGDNVRVRWSGNSEPDVAGYIVYRAETQGGGPSRITSTLVTGTEFLDNSVPATDRVWYEVSAVDESGNESPRSSTFAVTLTAAATDWVLQVGFPNPSPAASAVTIPLTVPQSGAAGAVLEIVDSGGHRIRRIDLAGLGAGAQNVTWDGRNDAARDVAPGVYRAWLIAGDTRQTIRLVRVP